MPHSNRFKTDHREVIGLLPAGGQATRIAPLPCSKELYPIGFQRANEEGCIHSKVVCHYLLEKMCLADIHKAYMILRDGKWDIPAYLGDGSMLNMHLAYLILGLPFGVPYTLDQAYPFVQNSVVALGFPDILFQPDDAFVQLLERQHNTNADVVLGVFPVDEPHKWDMVDIGDDGKIRKILIKPVKTELQYTWIIAIWTSAFTHFMHTYLSALQEGVKQGHTEKNVPGQRELFVGDVIQAAIDNDLQVEGVLFPDAACLDIGTPDDLVKAVCDNSERLKI